MLPRKTIRIMQDISDLIEAAITHLRQFVQHATPPNLPQPFGLPDHQEIPPFPFAAELNQFTELTLSPALSKLVLLLRTPEFAQFAPVLWGVAIILLIVIVVRAPHPLRGPRIRRRDAQRGYKIALRNEIMSAAGFRCESPRFLIWGRCATEATQVDHIYPWSRGGPTTRTNGQALCAAHNQAKSASTPAWWYVLGLERRRKLYYPIGTPVRVQAYPRRKTTRKRPRRSSRSRRHTPSRDLF